MDVAVTGADGESDPVPQAQPVSASVVVRYRLRAP
jgi:hypothetical protein